MLTIKEPSLPPLKKGSAPRPKRPSDRYVLNVSDYEIVHEIKCGGFGVVNLVRHKRTKEELASKTNLIQAGQQNITFVSREIRILIQVQHPTIIQFRGFSFTDFENKNNITIFMDYMREGSLADLISKEKRGLCPLIYDNTKRQIILIGIARGMMILHSRNIIHRDIKPENILLDNNLYPRITDFGLSKFFDPYHSMNQTTGNLGTVQYMAPEVIKSDHFNTKADVYAFGILMYEIIVGQRAYENLLKGPNKLSTFQLIQASSIFFFEMIQCV